MVNQFSEAASQNLDVAAGLFSPRPGDAQASLADRSDHNILRTKSRPDLDWQGWHPRHREMRLHPALFIVLVNLGVVALGLTASLGLVSLSDEAVFEVAKAPPEIIPARPSTPAREAVAEAAVTVAPIVREVPASPAVVVTQGPEPVVQAIAMPLKTAILPASPAKGSERNGYVLQVGAFADPAGAARMQATLKRHGYSAVVQPSSEGGKPLRVVRIGGFHDRNEAVQAAGMLESRAGLGSIIMKAPQK